MAISMFLTLILFLWVAFQGLKHSRLRSSALRRLFPFTNADNDNVDGNDVDQAWTIRTTLIGLQITTTTLNEAPRRILSRLGKGHRKALVSAYDLGIGWGVVGIVVSVGILAWEGGGLIAWLCKVLGRHGQPVRVVKRAVTMADEASSATEGVIQPLIPGLTLPISHAAYLILSFMVAQLVHEPGHAFTAALSNITPLLSSVHLSPVLPSASVTLPRAELAALPGRKRAGIASAGCWHNALFAGALWLSSALSSQLLERNVAGTGRVVLDVNVNSALQNVLLPGMVILSLDDLSLRAKSQSRSDELWNQFLSTDPESSDSREGWCVPMNWFSAQPVMCGSSNISLIRFDDLSSSGLGSHCLPPHPILTTTLDLTDSNAKGTPLGYSRCPCSSAGDICVGLDPAEKIVRIAVKDDSFPAGQVRTIVWQGPRFLVRDQVRTSTSVPILPTVFYPFILSAKLFTSYLLIISITLAVFNLLPLPILDGGLLLSSLLEIVLGAGSVERQERGDEEEVWALVEEDRGREEGMRGTTRGRDGNDRRRTRRTIERAIHWGVGGLGAWVLGGVFVRLLVQMND